VRSARPTHVHYNRYVSLLFSVSKLKFSVKLIIIISYRTLSLLIHVINDQYIDEQNVKKADIKMKSNRHLTDNLTKSDNHSWQMFGVSNFCTEIINYK